jgi:predicted GNAT family acetyltransferase
MHHEELGVNPLESDREVFERSVALRIGRRAIHIARDRGRIGFKAEVGAVCSYGAQLEGVYTVPELRGRGLATRALAQLCARLLGTLPMITLHVHETNTSALRAYENLGFRSAGLFRLVSVD